MKLTSLLTVAGRSGKQMLRESVFCDYRGFSWHGIGNHSIKSRCVQWTRVILCWPGGLMWLSFPSFFLLCAQSLLYSHASFLLYFCECGGVNAHLCTRRPEVGNGHLLHCSYTLFIETGSLGQAYSPLIWLILLDTLPWGSFDSVFQGLDYRWATTPTQHLCRFWNLHSGPHTCLRNLLNHLSGAF